MKRITRKTLRPGHALDASRGEQRLLLAESGPTDVEALPHNLDYARIDKPLDGAMFDQRVAHLGSADPGARAVEAIDDLHVPAAVDEEFDILMASADEGRIVWRDVMQRQRIVEQAEPLFIIIEVRQAGHPSLRIHGTDEFAAVIVGEQVAERYPVVAASHQDEMTLAVRLEQLVDEHLVTQVQRRESPDVNTEAVAF